MFYLDCEQFYQQSAIPVRHDDVYDDARWVYVELSQHSVGFYVSKISWILSETRFSLCQEE